MKKMVISLAALLMLFGCGSKGGSDAKTCTLEQAGIKIESTAKGEDDKIKTMSVKTTAPASMFGEGVDFSAITEDEKKTLEAEILKSMNVEEGQGVKITPNFSKTGMEITIDIDLEKAKDSLDDILSSANVNVDENQSMKSFVEEMEKAGAECK